MQRAVDKIEVMPMTNEQSEELEDLRGFYELQKAIDQIADPESIRVLEAQKKKLSDRLESRR